MGVPDLRFLRRALPALLLALAIPLVPAPALGAKRHDRDGDALSDRFERRASKTNPRRRDTDADGLGDGMEVRRTRTDPRRRDSDHDGLTDGFEVNLAHGTGVGGKRGLRIPAERRKTDPRRRDTDGDGLGDGYEIKTSHTDPADPDSDSDGLTDLQELLLGFDPRDGNSFPKAEPAAPESSLPGGPAGTAEQDWAVPAPADVTPPETSIGSGPAEVGPLTSASFVFSSSEAGSTFECRLDTQEWAGCISPKTYSGLALGAHTFSVRAKDGAGNLDGSPAARTWTIATPAPTNGCDSTVSTSAALAAAAVAATNEGKVVCVSPGTYADLDLHHFAHPTKVTLRSAQKHGAVLGDVRLRTAQGLRFEDFRVTGSFDLAGSTAQPVTRIEVAGADIGGGPNGAFLLTCAVHDFLAERNNVHDIAYNGQWWSGWGMNIYGDPGACGWRRNLTVRYNTFSSTGQDAMEVGGVDGAQIVGNVFRNIKPPPGSDAHTDSLMIWAGSQNFLVKDNRFEDGRGLLISGTSDVRFENNLVVRMENWCWQNGPSGSSPKASVRTTWVRNTVYDCGSDWNGGGFGGGYGFNANGDVSGSEGNRLERNVLTSFSSSAAAQFAYQDYNVIQSGSRPGIHDLALTPQFRDRSDYQPTNLPPGYEDVGYKPMPAGHLAAQP